MKNLLMFAIGALLVTAYAFTEAPENESAVYIVNTKASKILWTAKKVTGEHNGVVEISEGSVMLDNDEISTAIVTMNMNTITCSDIENETYNQKLVGHLKSEDFFSVELFPEASFEASSFIPMAETTDGGENFTINGNLTIKGITQEISFPARVDIENGTLNANGTATIDRTMWDIRYGSGKFFDGLGDKMIYDDFNITFILVASSNN